MSGMQGHCLKFMFLRNGTRPHLASEYDGTRTGNVFDGVAQKIGENPYRERIFIKKLAKSQEKDVD